MKKILFLFIIITFVGNSCTKDNVIEDQPKSKNISVLDYANGSAETTWHDNHKIPGVEGVDFGCWGDPTNCAKVVNISSTPIQNMFEDIFETIETGTKDDIIGVFEEYEDDLSDYLCSNYIEGVIDGDYTVNSRGDSFEDGKYMIFIADDEIVRVDPFVFD